MELCLHLSAVDISPEGHHDMVYQPKVRHLGILTHRTGGSIAPRKFAAHEFRKGNQSLVGTTKKPHHRPVAIVSTTL